MIEHRWSPSSSAAQGLTDLAHSTDLSRVKAAMLAMQRASWEQGVAAQALWELGELEELWLMAKDAVVRMAPDGRLAALGSPDQVTDPAANGEPVLRAARLTGDPELAAGARRMLAYLLDEAPRAADGTLYHLVSKPEVWVDSLYMAPPFLAVAGEPTEAVRQVEGIRRRLWQPDRRLFSPIWDDGEQKLRRAACWGVGNGWAAAGLTRVALALPASMAAERGRVASYAEEVIAGCLVYQREDGLFHDVLDDPGSFVETNLAQMLAYAIYRGVRAGWLAEDYLGRADQLRRAVHGKVDGHGLVQGVCGAPAFDRPGTATEGQAFFLLMEAAACERQAAGPGSEAGNF